MFDAATLEPLGRPADVGEPAFYVTAGPDNRTAFVLIGGPSGNTFWSDTSKRWALVDLESGTVLRKGELDMGVGWARRLTGRPTRGGHRVAGRLFREVSAVRRPGCS